MGAPGGSRGGGVLGTHGLTRSCESQPLCRRAQQGRLGGLRSPWSCNLGTTLLPASSGELLPPFPTVHLWGYLFCGRGWQVNCALLWRESQDTFRTCDPKALPEMSGFYCHCIRTTARASGPSGPPGPASTTSSASALAQSLCNVEVFRVRELESCPVLMHDGEVHQ